MWTNAGSGGDLDRLPLPSGPRPAPGKQTLTAQLKTNRPSGTSAPTAAAPDPAQAASMARLTNQADALTEQAFAFRDDATAAAAPATTASLGLPWLGLPGCAPAGPDIPADDAAALDRWRKGHARFLGLYNAGLAFVPPANEAQPSTDTLFRNTCQWIRDGQVTLTLVSLAAAPRQTAANDQYIGDGIDALTAVPSATQTTGGFDGEWGSCDGTTMWLVDLMADGWTDDYIKGTLIHEIQHDADKGPGNDFSRDPANFEDYQSEFRARWLEPTATVDYGDPAQPATNDAITYDDNGTPRTMQGVGFHNARQKGIFAKLVGIGGQYYGAFAHDFLTSNAFKTMVLALDEAIGGNVVNSVRIDALVEQIATGQPARDVLAAGAALDATDCRTLADRGRSADFWASAARLPAATRQQLEALIDNPGTYVVYVVVAGDTLSRIAAHELGDEQRWPDIYNLPANQAQVGGDPDVIAPGLPLLLP